MFPSMAVKAGITSSGSHILPTAYRKGTWTGDRIKTVEDVPGPTTLGAVHPSFAKPHYVKRPRASFVGPFPSPSDSPFFLHDVGYDPSHARQPTFAENTREQSLASVLPHHEELALRDGFAKAWEHEHAAREMAEVAKQMEGSCVSAVLNGRVFDMVNDRHSAYHTREVNSLRSRIETERAGSVDDVLSPYTAARRTMKGRYIDSEQACTLRGNSLRDQALTQYLSGDHHY